MTTPTYLARLHPHERDKHITFDEGPHIYHVDGDSSFTSVTKWNHQHFKPFNASLIIRKMMNSKKWPRSKYFGKTAQEIKDGWSKSGQEAAAAGTKLHYDIECFWNMCSNKNDSVEYQYFLNFNKQFPLKPYRTEWTIWDKEHKLSGSVDFIAENEDGSLTIYDWKRSKEIKKFNNFDSAITPCINHLPDANFWHYALQLNTYRKIIENNYGKKIHEMYLVCLHPNKPNFQRIKVPRLEEEMNELFKERKKSITKSITESIVVNS